MFKKIKNFFFYETEDNTTFKERFINTLKNPKELLKTVIPIILILSLLLPVPYYITTSGGIINLEDKIKVENKPSIKGSFNSAYVTQIRGTVFSYLLSYIIPDYEKEKISDVKLDNEEIKDYTFREKLYFKQSISNATKVAFDLANENITKEKEDIYVVYIEDKTKTTLKVQDIILKVFDEKISSKEDLLNAINKYSYKDEINMEVLRGNKKVDTVSKFTTNDNEKILGISVMEDVTYKKDKDITFKFSSKEEGPSGGLMIALSIYNQLTKDDLTKGRKIAGTGTISLDGTVGEIGGIKYKLKGAVKNKADIFLVPKENYDEALKYKKEKNYDIELVKVETIKDAIEYLQK